MPKIVSYRKDGHPTFDAVKFAAFFRRWKEHEGLSWQEIADLAGVHYSTVNNMARGTPQRFGQKAKAAKTGYDQINPPINTLLRLADAMNMEVGYLISKGGVAVYADRWSNFTHSEREELIGLLRNYLHVQQALGLPERSPIVRRLLTEIEAAQPAQHEENPE